MQSVASAVFPDTYRDSVFLMKISSHASSLEGITLASAMMATPRNKDIFSASGLMTQEIEQARPDDIAVSLAGESEALATALGAVRKMLDTAGGTGGGAGGAGSAYRPKSVAEATKALPGLNMALISVPGEYAAYEAFKALRQGLNVMLYSDNVSLDDERRLKTFAGAHNLLLMGPDCGTALLNGVPLGFVNKVRRGGLGLVCASGTGAQEVMCLVDRFGGGISHCLGVGGRDLKDAIGGLSTIQALALLDADPSTEAIAVIGKPPGPKTRTRLAEIYRKLCKPVTVYYAGCDDMALEIAAGATVGHSLEEAAMAGLALLAAGADRQNCQALPAQAEQPRLKATPGSSRKWLRGVFSGGTLCLEALSVAAGGFPGRVWSNMPLAGACILPDAQASCEHTLVDLGDDAFSVGRPHPMIDPALRLERLFQELMAPDTAVVLLDVVLGYGAASGQAEGIARTIARAAAESQGASREVLVVASVCGTAADVPSRPAETEILRQAGVLVCSSNARAAHMAVALVKEASA